MQSIFVSKLTQHKLMINRQHSSKNYTCKPFNSKPITHFCCNWSINGYKNKNLQKLMRIYICVSHNHTQQSDRAVFYWNTSVYINLAPLNHKQVDHTLLGMTPFEGFKGCLTCGYNVAGLMINHGENYVSILMRKVSQANADYGIRFAQREGVCFQCCLSLLPRFSLLAWMR